MADYADASVESAQAESSLTHDAICTYLTKNRKQLLAVILRFESNYEVAEDILSTVTVEALSHPEGFKGEASVGTYLTRIATNQAITHVRKAVRRKTGARVFYAHELGASPGEEDEHGDGSGGDLLLDSGQADEATPEKYAEFRQLLGVVETYLPLLEERYPTAFRTWKLHRIDGLDYKEIEELTGTKASTAFLHVFRISEALTGLMDGTSKPPRSKRK